MASERKFFHNIVTIHVLSEDEPLSGDMSLSDIDYAITDGDSVGGGVEIRSEEMTGKEAATRLSAYGSEPGFFQLDEDGNDLED
jgi:hypothetical protein